MAVVLTNARLAVLRATERLAVVHAPARLAGVRTTERLAAVHTAARLAVIRAPERLAVVPTTERLALLRATERLAVVHATERRLTAVHATERLAVLERLVIANARAEVWRWGESGMYDYSILPRVHHRQRVRHRQRAPRRVHSQKPKPVQECKEPNGPSDSGNLSVNVYGSGRVVGLACEKIAH